MPPLVIEVRKSGHWIIFGIQPHRAEPGKLPDGISFVGVGDSFVIRKGETELRRLRDGQKHELSLNNPKGEKINVRFTHRERE